MRYIDIIERTNLGPDFDEWFRGSLVVDDSGQPLRCYHGSFNDFDEFNTGSHFGSVDAANDRIDNVRADGGKRFAGNHGVVYPVFLSIKNPLRIDDDGGLIDGHDLANAAFKAKAISWLERQELGGPFEVSGVLARRRLFNLLAEKGYDGLVYHNTIEGNGDSWVIFRSDQVRRAI